MSRRWTVGAVLAVAIGIAAALGLLGCATAPGESVAAAASEPADLVIRDVRLFDGERVHERAVVVVRNGRRGWPRGHGDRVRGHGAGEFELWLDDVALR